MLKIPFSFLPRKVILGIAHSLKTLGGFLSAFFPGLHEELFQAQISESPREYAAIAFSVAATNALFSFALVALIGVLAQANILAVAFGVSMVLGLASFFTLIYYPRVIISKRKRLLESQLIPATRQFLIELRSGVPLFNSMTSIATGYGEVSVEFRKIITQINGGVSELDALQEATRANPSLQFRKILWQISNALKVGSDVGDSLESLMSDLTKEKVDEIHRYGQELSPWTMIYMMLAVVLPSLGVTLLIVISSFLSVSIPSIVLPITVIFLIGFQLFFMNFISSRRPMI
jgi:flagellar protein FlaJ